MSLLAEKEHDIEQLMDQYEEVSINIYIRSELAEIGFTLPQNIIQKLAFIKCPVNFEILSFGMAPNSYGRCQLRPGTDVRLFRMDRGQAFGSVGAKGTV